MGSWVSKPARQLGQQVTSQALRQGTPSRPPGAARQAPQQEVGPQAARYAPPPASAPPAAEAYSESKTQAVRSDGQDPQLLANLQKLGQVQVPRGKVRYKQSNPMLGILAARQRNSELEQGANTAAQLSSGGVSNVGAMRNRLNAQSITSLLDQRKECKSRRELDELAAAYEVDIAVLDQLARFVNSPSIEAGSKLRERKPVAVEDEEGLPDRVDAVWTEPALADVRAIGQ